MPNSRSRWSDDRIDRTIAALLRAGLLLATLVVVVGAAVFLVRHGSERADHRFFRGEPSDLRSIGGIVGESLAARGTGLIQLGLVILLATPVVRVAFSVVAFGLQRDWFYVAVTLFVLVILLYGIFGGYAGTGG